MKDKNSNFIGTIIDNSYEAIKSKNLPIYLYGAFHDSSNFILNWISVNGGSLAAVYDDDYLLVNSTDKHHDFTKRYNALGLKVTPFPDNVQSIPQGVVIIATDERDFRSLQVKWKGSTDYHYVIDASDIQLYPTYLNCSNAKGNTDDLFRHCSGCPASYKHCPVRSEWYSLQGLSRSKVIRHIAIKAGWKCNLSCKYCCEFIPQFSDKHKYPFDTDALITDIEKLSNSLEFIHTLSLSGGDVLLNKDLGRVIEKAASLNNIGCIYCLTNGTYIPPTEVLDAIEKTCNKVSIAINNYAINNEAVPLIDELNRRSIRSNLRERIKWYDFSDLGFRNRNINELKDLYQKCAFDAVAGYYHVMINGKINMRCGVANGILHLLDKWSDNKQDYIDIRVLQCDDIPSALIEIEDRGYVDICNYCPGQAVNERTIMAADEQENLL